MSPSKVNLKGLSQALLGLALSSILATWLISGGFTTAVRKIKHHSLEHASGRVSTATHLKVMFVGDSITHGNEGDYTWRYRLWEWLQSQHIEVDFVGPFNGTYRPPDAEAPAPPVMYGEPKKKVTEANTNGSYAATFPQRHFAIAGRSAGYVKGLVQDVTRSHPADIVLVLLGFNDLKVFGANPTVLSHDILVLISNIRKSLPHVKFVVGTVPQVSNAWTPPSNDLVERTNHYNELLKLNAPDWSSEASPVHVADVEELYDCGPQFDPDCPAGFDGLHPNELGEYQIAQAFSRTLVKDLQVGQTPILHYDVPKRVIGIPTNLSLVPSPRGVTATWDRVFGAYNYEINVKKSSEPDKASQGTIDVNEWHSDSRFAPEGMTFHFRVRARSGHVRVGEWSEWQTAIAQPKRPPPATNVTAYAESGSNTIEVSWVAPSDDETQIAVYNVKLDNCGQVQTAAFNGTSGQIKGLKRGVKYRVEVESWSFEGVAGPLVAGSAVIVGSGTPDQVVNLKARSKSATVAQMTWDAVEGATGYMVWRTNIKTNETVSVEANPVGVTCFTSKALLAGISEYRWTVAAINGDAQGTTSTPVIAAKVDGSPVEPCPTPSSTCPV